MESESVVTAGANPLVNDTRDDGASTPTPLPPAISLLKLHYNAQEAPPRLVRNRSNEMRASLQMPPRLPRELARYRSDSLPVEPRLSVYSTSGTAYESVVVVGHMFGNDNVVYYLLEVRSWEMPLEGYVIRRRYNDFKKFHQELAKFMPASTKPRSSSYGGFGVYYSSLLCNPLVDSSSPELNPLWSPKRSSDGDDDSSTRKNTRGSSGDDVEFGCPEDAQVPDDNESDARSSFSSAAWTESGAVAPAAATLEYSVPSTPAQPGMTYYDSNLTLPLDSVKFTMSDRPVLPDMPTGGVGAIFSTRQTLIKYRVEQFNKILAAVMSDDSRDVATVLMNFIQEKPGGPGTAYTSLSEYAAIDLPWKLERYARRRAMSMGRRPPSLFREQSGGSSSASAQPAASAAVGTAVP